MVRQAVGLIAVALATAAGAQDMTPRMTEPAATVAARRPPVTAGDIVDRPYRVIGPVRATVRKLFIFSSAPTEDRIHRELWERAERMGADAVIFAEYGSAETELGKVGAREASGRAIKFLPAPQPALPR